MKRDSRLALAVAVVALALSSIPYAVAYLAAPPDRIFMGIVSSVADWSQYLAWMRAFARRVVIENVLTCEPQSAAFFNLQWLILGRLSNLLPAAIVLQLFRLGTAALFLWLTWRVCAEYFAGDRYARWVAWLLINFSAGFGWLWVLEKRLSGLADARYPNDIYVFEPVSFQNMVVFPHFLLAAALLLAIFRLAARAVESERLMPAFAASALALCLGLSHAYDLIIVYAVLGVFVLCLWRRDGFSWRPLVIAAVIGVVSAPPPLYFVYLTSRSPLWRTVLAQFANGLVFTPSLPHLAILLGVPLLLVLATVSNVFPKRWPATWPLLVRVWAVVNLPLLYIPTDYQIHMLSGWQIPLGLLASEGLFGLVVPWLVARGWLSGGASPTQRRLALSRPMLVVLLIAFAVPTNVYLLAWRVREVLKLQHTHYLYTDEVAALSWLDKHSGAGEVVLSSPTLGAYVPFLAGNKVVVGHWAQTVRYEAKKAASAQFYDAGTAALQRRLILKACRVRYVVHGRGERALGSFDPASAADLKPVHTDGETTIYRVEKIAEPVVTGAAPTPSPQPPTPSPRPPTRTPLQTYTPRPSPPAVGRWSAPIVLSSSYRYSWFPDVAAEPTGKVHAFWSSAAGGFDMVAHCRPGPGACIEEDVAARRDNRASQFVTRPSASIAADGTLHLIWRSVYKIAHQKIFLPDPVDGWSVPYVLGEGTYSTIAAAGDGVVHAAWSQVENREEDKCKSCADIYYSRSTDGGETWSKGLSLASTPVGSEKPQLALGADGTIYLIWEEGRDHYAGGGVVAPVMMAVSRDQGVTWSSPFRLATANGLSPAIAVAGDGTVLVAWRPTDQDLVVFQTSRDRGATWSMPEPIPGLRRRYNSPDELDAMELATDPSGAVHLAVVARPDAASSQNVVYHVTWDGQSWSAPEEVFRTNGTAEWPRLAIANGNQLHLVWFERDNVWSTNDGAYTVWYAHAISDAPAIEPDVWPAPPFRLIRWQTALSLLQLAAAIAVVATVIGWARRRGL